MVPLDNHFIVLLYHLLHITCPQFREDNEADPYHGEKFSP